MWFLTENNLIEFKYDLHNVICNKVTEPEAVHKIFWQVSDDPIRYRFRTATQAGTYVQHARVVDRLYE